MIRMRTLSSLKIVLKESLRQLPFIGWGMQLCQFIFLSRKWENDEARIAEILSYACDNNDPISMLIFPEGTDLSPQSLVRSHEYSKKNNLALYNYVMHPRYRGTLHCLRTLTERPDNQKAITALHDVTIGYHDNGERPVELSVLAGKQPFEIHVLVKRYDIEELRKQLGFKAADDPSRDIQAEDAAFEAWLNQRFAEKEQNLTKFYANGRFDEQSTCVALSATPIYVQSVVITSFISLATLLFAFKLPLLFTAYTVASLAFFVGVSTTIGFDSMERKMNGRSRSVSAKKTK